MFTCPICGNKDQKYIGIRAGHKYCRKCISFRGSEISTVHYFSDSAEYSLSYELTDDQQRLSNRLIDNYKNHKNTLVHAVCGAGKTEIVLASISYAISNHQKVGFCVPRVDVVKELYLRFSSIFKHNVLTLVYGGHTNNIQGDLVCLTSHQLYRFNHYFDLLIMDEIDAFPFQDNEVLEAFFKRSIKGNFIMMSATPSEKVKKEFSGENAEILHLNTRFHMQKLPIPVFKIGKGYLKFILLIHCLRSFKKLNKQVFIFTPTIDICESTFGVISTLFKNCSFVHSKCIDRSERIDRFRKGYVQFLVTTAVLERGVTVKDLQVIVFMADHSLYNSSSLIQISGRAGRKKDAPKGEVIFIADEITKDMEKCVSEIKNANKDLLPMF